MNILITGGAGYVGSLLVPRLLSLGHKVTVLDLFIFKYIFQKHENLNQVYGDIRHLPTLFKYGKNKDVIIHLACVSNDPSCDLDPIFSKSVNYDATKNIVAVCDMHKIKRLIVASSTSQYGVKPLDIDVTEDVKAEPITDYGRYKIESEKYILESNLDTDCVFVRPSTLCGYAPRLRLDLVVNSLTIQSLINQKINVEGGTQIRPVLNILDMVRFYELLLTAPSDKIRNEAFNLLYKNMTVMDIAKLVKDILGGEIVIKDIKDYRSYHVNGDKVKRVLGFENKYSIKDGILSLKYAYDLGLIVDGLNNPVYYNVKRMKEYINNVRHNNSWI